MKLTFALLCSAVGLSACSTIGIPKYDEEKDKYMKTHHDTMNMSEYDRQRYYDQNGLGLIEPYNRYRPRR